MSTKIRNFGRAVPGVVPCSPLATVLRLGSVLRLGTVLRLGSVFPLAIVLRWPACGVAN